MNPIPELFTSTCLFCHFSQSYIVFYLTGACVASYPSVRYNTPKNNPNKPCANMHIISMLPSQIPVPAPWNWNQAFP